MRKPVERAIWYVESHFSRGVTLDDVAGVCGLSRFEMSRAFTQAAGMPFTAYLRARRLSEAARALAGGGDIIAVAVEAGYGSHEAFTRAFRRQFGVTPSEVRACGTLKGLPIVGPLREDPDFPPRLARPRIEHRGPLAVAGLTESLTQDDLAGIPAIWQRLHPHLAARGNAYDGVAWGVVSGISSGEAGFRYLAGVEIGANAEPDPDFEAMRFPAQTYAVFTHHGHVTAITSSARAIRSDWLPRSGFTPTGTPDFLERYDRRFDSETGSGGFEIWIPVERA
ncbi:MAG: AraC family transcriptional regulator [Rhizobiaceae bacterium]|nr:AraC family transcriptional regulator [Rhizobiaceae bacterium]MCV0405327.1 AraC family transcriptional regulator [Rhizobiaceae bacterium]